MNAGNIFSQHSTFQSKKISKLYEKQKYEQILANINKIENKGSDNYYTYQYRGKYKNSVDFYFYKTASLIKTKKYETDFDKVLSDFKHLNRIDKNYKYNRNVIFNDFMDYIDFLSKEEFKRDNITKSLMYCDLLKKYWNYENIVFSTINTHINIKNYSYDDIKKYNFDKIDSIASNVENKSNIRDQTWVLTKNLKTDVERIRVIYTWIILNISYDNEQKRKILNRIYVNTDAETVFQKRKTICSGYSNLFVEMCKYAHIKSIVDTGKVGDYYHAWNKVDLNGQTFYIDVTWSDNGNVIDDKYFLALNR